MADTIQFGIRLTADGSSMVGTVNVSKAALKELGDTATKAGDQVATSQRKAAQEAQSAATAITGAMNSVRTAILGAFSVAAVYQGLKEFTASMIASQIQMDRWRSGFTFAFGDVKAAGQQLEYVRQTANRFGLDLATTADSYLKISAASKGTNLEGEKTRRVFEAVSGAATVLGLSMQDTQGVFLALNQMVSKGTVQSEELRGQLGERLPGAFQIAARAMGVTTGKLGEMLEKGEVLAVDFLPRFAAELEKSFGKDAEKAAQNLQGSINRLNNSFTDFKTTLADSAIGQGAGGQFTALSQRVDAVTEAIKRAKAEGSGFWGSLFAAGSQAMIQLQSYGVGGPAVSQAGELGAREAAQKSAVDDIRKLYAVMDKEEREGNKGKVQAIQKTIEALNLEIQARQQIIDKIKEGMKSERERAAGPRDSGANNFEAFTEAGAARRDAALKYVKQQGFVPDTDRFKEASQQLAKFRLEGSITKAEFDKFLAEADKDLNKSLRASLSQRIAVLEQQNGLTLAFYQTSQALQQDALRRTEQADAASYANRFISEQTYNQRSLASQREQAQSRLDAVNAEIEATQRLEAAIRSQKPRDAGEREQLNAKLVESERKLMQLGKDRTVAERDLGDIVVRTREKQYALDLKEFDAEVKIGLETQAYLLKLKEETAETQFQLSLIGQSEEAQRRLTAERQVRLDAEKEIRRIIGEIADLEQRPGSQGRIISLWTQIDDIRAGASQRAREAGELATQIGIASEKAAILQSMWQGINGVIGDTLTRFKGNWHSATMYARDQILQNIYKTLYDLTVSKFILNIVAPIATGMASNVANTVSNGIVNGAIGQGVSYAGSAAASYLGYSGGVGTVGQFVGAASGSIPSAAIGSAAVEAGVGVDTMAAGVGSYLYEALASLGPYGWIAIAVIAIASWLSGAHKGGPKVGGSGNLSFDANGNPIGNVPVPGTDNGRFFTPNQGDNQTNALLTSTAGSYYALAKALGGTGSAFTFGLGFDHDPQGTAQSRVSAALTDSSGRVIYNNRDQNMDDKDVPAALQLESERLVFAALQQSDLPSTIKKLLQALDVSTATKDAMDSALALAASWQQILQVGQRSIGEDANELYDIQTRGAHASLQKQGADLVTLAGKFDGSAQSTQELAAAQNAYRQAVLQSLLALKQVAAELKDMFSTTRDKFTRAGMTDQQTYNYLQQRAQERLSQLGSATDASQVQAIMRDVNDYLNQAFDILTPEEQKAHRQEFLDAVDRMETASNVRLKEITDQIIDESKAPFEAIATKMDQAADKMLAAANALGALGTRFNNNTSPAPTPGTTDGSGLNPLTYRGTSQHTPQEAGV